MFKNTEQQIYSAYGIGIQSVVALPDLLPKFGSPEVEIFYGNAVEKFQTANAGQTAIFERRGCRIQTSERAMLLEWEAVGKVLVCDGREVIVEPEETVSERDLQPFLTGPVLSVVLHQRKKLVLHASAVIIGGAAAVFLGAKGEGKSTLAACLQTAGHALVSDDIVPVGFEHNTARTYSGYPKIKLFADSVEAVGASPSTLPLIHQRAEKFSFDGAKNFSTASVPLGAIYVLSSGTETKIKRLDLKSSFIELTRHSHLNRFLKALNNRRQHFEQCRELVKTVPIYGLQRPRCFEKINEINLTLQKHALENYAAGANVMTA